MLIHMPTGTGKTKTSMHIITNYIEFTLQKKGLVIWVAHTIELLEQAYKTFCDVWGHLGDGEISAYKLWGSHNIQDTSTELNGIAFCGLSKLMSLYDSNPELFERLKKDCRLVVFDEAHKAAADKTKRIIENNDMYIIMYSSDPQLIRDRLAERGEDTAWEIDEQTKRYEEVVFYCYAND